jgi:acyl-CoA synthetase (AMP-forming)/AMP-acid ligase II
MTKKLSELFDLPENLPETVTVEQAQQQIAEHQSTFAEIDSAIDKIDAALPGVRGLDASDAEMDELAQLAKDKFEDLMDLGMAMEARFSGTVFQTAGVLLGHAISAKQAKLDKKLRMVDLQLKKMRLDQQSKDSGTALPNAVEGEGTVIDRNSLLAEILKQQKK